MGPMVVELSLRGESRYRKVYVKRNKQSEGAVPSVSPVRSPLALPTPTRETLTPSNSDSEYTCAMIPLSTTPTPLSMRTPRENAGISPDRYGFLYEIVQFVSYSHISSVHRAFIASLNTVSIHKCWQVAKGDMKWKAAMLEELEALLKNKTWELVPLPPGKKTVGCKWVFTVKHNPEGLVVRYKAMLVAKVYSQTYDIDYDETFAPVTKIEVACGAEGIVLSQMKYLLDLLIETDMLGCRSAVSPIDVKAKISA